MTTVVEGVGRDKQSAVTVEGREGGESNDRRKTQSRIRAHLAC